MRRHIASAVLLLALLLACVRVSGQVSESSGVAISASDTSAPEPPITDPPAPLTPMNADTLRFLQSLLTHIRGLEERWSGSEYCKWEGVTCDAAGLVDVVVSARGLWGIMEDYNMKSIDGANVLVRTIDMSLNTKIVGTVPLNWYTLANLQKVDLSGTSVTGALPDGWGRMPQLQEVRISGTRLCGNLPNWNMPSLRVVDLRGNRLRGSLSPYWSSMTALTSVEISGNDFCGCVPDSWKVVPVLASAGANAGGGVTSDTCATKNKCRYEFSVCRDAAMGPAGTALLALAALVAAAVAL